MGSQVHYRIKTLFTMRVKLYVTILVLFVLITNIECENTKQKGSHEGRLQVDQKNNLLQDEEDDSPPEDGESSDPGLTPVGSVESVSYETCSSGNRICCFQFTWPGPMDMDAIPVPANNTCLHQQLEKHSLHNPCFDPLVYTVQKEGRRPDLTALTAGSQEYGWKIFCERTAGVYCLKHTFYRTGGSSSGAIVNETRFCGAVTDLTSGKDVSNGCYKTKSNGLTQEICVCDGDILCNDGPTNTYKSSLLLLPIVAIVAWLQEHPLY